jgi:mRNA (guanine-N7-)-methyltransferase
LNQAIQGRSFNVVSVQFALHYAFESEEKVRFTMSAIADALCPGAVFFGTVDLIPLM